ncbi:type III secretion system protein [Chlamydia pecorum W73]|nr:type III secretion system gatekeeper subunit SctW [Chlamydia pecorum]AGW38860.1 type III secretion system protein [Chlamydia pecorum W73]
MAAGGTGGLGGSKAVDLSAVQAAQAKADAAEVIASQESSEMSFVRDVPDSTNPAAATRTKKKEDTFKSLESRRKGEAKTDKKTETGDKSGQDLADKYTQGNSEVSGSDLRGIRDQLSDDSSTEDVLNLLASKFNDPALQALALDYLVQTTPSSSADLKEALVQARNTLLQQHGTKVSGGRNVLFASQQYGEALGVAPSSLRDIYNVVTTTNLNCHQLLDLLKGQYSHEEMCKVSSFLLNGMSADLKSEGPSVEPPKLQLLMSEIRNLQAILTSYEFFDSRAPTILDSLKTEGHTISPNVNSRSLADAFQGMINDKFPSSSKMERSLQELVGNETEVQTAVMNLFVTALNNTSARLYASASRRQDLKMMMLNTLDSINRDNEDYPKATDFPKPYPWS